jgi:hypothetical protein
MKLRFAPLWTTQPSHTEHTLAIQSARSWLNTVDYSATENEWGILFFANLERFVGHNSSLQGLDKQKNGWTLKQMQELPESEI